MIICNVKLNKKIILKTALLIMCIICITIGIIATYSILNKAKQNTETNIVHDCMPSAKVANLTVENYTNVLNAVHKDIDTYVGQKISFSGYVYRINGFSDNQFVLARDMDIGNKQTLIVGFLCSCEKAKEFETYTWVNITGEITKGSYNNESVPLVKITEIEKTSKPENSTVCLPDDEYVPTAVIY